MSTRKKKLLDDDRIYRMRIVRSEKWEWGFAITVNY